MSALESKEDRLRALSRIPLDALNTVLQRKKYRHLTLVGKSMGTMALALLSRDAKKWEYMPQSVESLWLTPLLKDTTIVGEIPRLGQRQYVVTGNQDVTHYSREGLESLPQSVEAVTVQGANHGLDIEGDALASTRVMTSVMEGISRFLDRSV
jgi:pimeloyl-ACP methyl ester carboxylesterase